MAQEVKSGKGKKGETPLRVQARERKTEGEETGDGYGTQGGGNRRKEEEIGNKSTYNREPLIEIDCERHKEKEKEDYVQ